ncbi:MAG: PHP domain-containing protein, partial [Solobacterium sp.]|nr:PHP domain-containing protein [Solobacterium sp.]
MTLQLNEIANELSIEEYEPLCRASVTAVRFFKTDSRLEIELSCESTLPFASYKAFRTALCEKTGSEVTVFVNSGKPEISNVELHRYLEDLYERHPETSLLSKGVLIIESSDKKISWLFSDDEERESAGSCLSDVEKMLEVIGLQGYHVSCDMQKIEVPAIKDVHISAPQPTEEAPVQRQPKKNYYRTKQEDYVKIELRDIHDPISDIQFDCDVFNEEITEVKKTGRIIQTLSVFDGTDAIMVKRFENNRTTREELSEVGKGDRIRIFGRIEYDNFARDLVCMPSAIEKLEKEKPADHAEIKRVEWHMHTNMSEMDGVCDIKEIVNYAFDIGHRGIVITDHADVQSFVKAFNAAQGCKKKDPERGFKVGLGCEMNMCNDELLIVRNPSDKSIDECEYIAFDLETTGLSCHFDHVIEFGGVKIRNQTVVDTKQMFIKPPVLIPSFISSKTNITNAMVANARTFAEAADEITAWIGDAVLVAHNATFDIHFLNEELKRIGRPPLHNTVIDTLDMSRA